ncbi:Uncharacterized protein OS=Sorangium cellulosum (strain So ce56) GN=sce5405 PE=4 SV=1 [Gemmata massiliana]|uniref:Uncharacterized protein n=1 Tax=Gemmata massiliana TaxID=1210884 RepID=A0A6P2CU09_9BACT|nr:hypothetical protein [Gemmata massiliana]VTR92393.1 Uncharacterized protein OS=Sorangium cellulosum (strain So ce56) GN=sce5405 PE=4 SV=1 [Gemmata massiliana]
MPKPNLGTRLAQELIACRTEGGDHYPIRLDHLAARLDPALEPAAVLKAVDSTAFKKQAVVTADKRIDARVALREDASLFAADPLTLEMAFRTKGETGTPPWSPSELAKTVPTSWRPAFSEILARQIASDELPAFAVQVKAGKGVKLHHKEQPPPPPPEVQDAERLVDMLRRRQPGVPLAELETAAELKPAAFKKAVKRPEFTAAVVQVKMTSKDVFVVPNGDAFGRFVTGTLLTHLLGKCKRPNAHAFPVNELVAHVSKADQSQITGLLNRPDLAAELPAGVGCVLLGGGKSGSQNAFFLLEHLRTAQPVARSVAALNQAPPPPPADFVATFDAAFARIDRERGSNNFVSLVDLRAALPAVPRETFDTCLRQLRRDRRYVLSSDERYDGITPEQQAAAIREEGEFLLHVSRGRP